MQSIDPCAHALVNLVFDETKEMLHRSVLSEMADHLDPRFELEWHEMHEMQVA